MFARACAWPVGGLLAAVVLAACVNGGHAARSTASGKPTQATARKVTMADARRCPVTMPRHGAAGVSPDDLFGWGSSYGNGKLWVGGLWPHGVIAADPGFVEKDGATDMKFGWWRKVAGKLEITGRRLDGPAPPLDANVPDGYGDTGFQATGVTFPREGCWQVTGKIGRTSLTFVTFVIKRPARTAGQR